MEELIILLQSIMDLQDSRMEHFQQVLKLQEANENARKKLDAKIQRITMLEQEAFEMKATICGLLNENYNDEEKLMLLHKFTV